jgi:putative membrane protein
MSSNLLLNPRRLLRADLVFFAVLFCAVATPALAHGGTDDAVPDWEWDFWVVTPLALSAVLYSRGVQLIWRRAGGGRGIKYWQTLCFAAGWLTLFGALCSPLHWLAEHLFSAHMVEHELLMAVAAPLLAISKPLGAFMRALPRNCRQALSRGTRGRIVQTAWRGVLDPTVATVLHAIALWVWHAPILFDATITNELLHRLQHISFLGTALIFWWALFRRPRAEFGMGAIHVSATMAHMSLLGALLAFSPDVLYRVQTASAPEFGLTPLQDQQLGGMIMWVPAGTIYAAIAVAMLAFWLAPDRVGTHAVRQRQAPS